MEAERLHQLRLQNQQLQQSLTTPTPAASDDKPKPEPTPAASEDKPKPQSDISAALKALYGCGVMDGMLKEALFLEKKEAANQIRETMKTTECDEIRKIVGAEVPEKNQ